MRCNLPVEGSSPLSPVVYRTARGGQRGKKARAGFDETARALPTLLGAQSDFRVALLGDSDCLFDRVSRRRSEYFRRSGQNESAQQLMAANFKRIGLSPWRPFLVPGMALTFPLYQVLQAGANSDTFGACSI